MTEDRRLAELRRLHRLTETATALPPDFVERPLDPPPAALAALTDEERELIEELAELDDLSYERRRTEAAERLGIRTVALDRLVERARPAAPATFGRRFKLEMPEPWPEQVALAELLHALVVAIQRHVVLGQAEAIAVALWIAHTYVYERFSHTPRLSITSPTKGCGKSTLLEILRLLTFKPIKADNISASGTFRTIEALAPLTLLIDEADSFLRDNEELRGVLNSGFEQSGEVIRVVETKDEHHPVRFRTFCPAAIAAIGRLPATIEDRAIPIVLQRRAPGEAITKLRDFMSRWHLNELQRKLLRWSLDSGRDLPASPPVPDVLGDREGDISIPLLAIADAAGGDWPEKARAALVALFTRRKGEDGAADLGTLLLKDCRMVFLETGATRIASAELASRLAALETRPWPEICNGRPITPARLARMLAGFGISPATIRVRNATPKGYHREAFEEAWQRYLSSDDPSMSVEGGTKAQQRHNAGNSRASGQSENATPAPRVALSNSPKPAENLGSGLTTRMRRWLRYGLRRGRLRRGGRIWLRRA